MCYDVMGNPATQRKRDSVIESRCYELTDYEKDAIRQITVISDRGYKEKSMLKDHIEYLSHLLSKLSGILEMEKSVGAPTLSLERDILKIKDLQFKLDKLKMMSE